MGCSLKLQSVLKAKMLRVLAVNWYKKSRVQNGMKKKELPVSMVS